MEELAGTLGKAVMFRGLDEKQLQSVIRVAVTKQVAQGAPIFKEGSVAPTREAPSEVGTRGGATATRHIARDYSYVRAEVRRIVLVGGFLIVSLIITALLRN